jgi:hypothetical protein
MAGQSLTRLRRSQLDEMERSFEARVHEAEPIERTESSWDEALPAAMAERHAHWMMSRRVA